MILTLFILSMLTNIFIHTCMYKYYIYEYFLSDHLCFVRTRYILKTSLVLYFFIYSNLSFMIHLSNIIDVVCDQHFHHFRCCSRVSFNKSLTYSSSASPSYFRPICSPLKSSTDTYTCT